MPSANKYVAANWYDSPFYYDLIFDQDSATEADFIESAWRKHGSPQTSRQRSSFRILEPACGSGRLMHELARRNHRVAGFDRNAAMLAAARDRFAQSGKKTTLKRESLESFSFSTKFDICHCLLSTFKYILDEEGAVDHLQAIADHLHPGGIYVLGIHLTDYLREHCEHERWKAKRGGVRVICNTRTWPPNKKTRREKLRNRLRILHDDQQEERCLETHWECRTYSQRQFLQLLAKVPALKAVAYYDFHHDIDQPKSRSALRDDVVFILRKQILP